MQKNNYYSLEIITSNYTAVFTASNIEQILETAPYKAEAVRPPITHHENYQN